MTMKGIFLFSCSIILSLVFLELGCRFLLPEVSDTFIIKLRSVGNRYHHRYNGERKSLQKDRFRIAFLGDSFTEGMGVSRKDAFPQLVGKYFNEGKITGEAILVQTFNLGTRSYSPSIYGVVARDFFPKIKPDLVVLAVDDSDPQDDLLYRFSLKVDEHGLPLSVYPVIPGVPPIP